jgi:hypothetical protein
MTFRTTNAHVDRKAIVASEKVQIAFSFWSHTIECFSAVGGILYGDRETGMICAREDAMIRPNQKQLKSSATMPFMFHDAEIGVTDFHCCRYRWIPVWRIYSQGSIRVAPIRKRKEHKIERYTYHRLANG